MHLLPNILLKRSRRVLGFDHHRAKLISWLRHMHQASQFDESMPAFRRLMSQLLNYLVWSRWKICSERPFISKNLWVANNNRMQPLKCLSYFLSNAAVCFAEIYLKDLSYRRQSFINLNQFFIQSFSKIRHFLPHTLWSKVRPTRLSKNLLLSENMAKINEIVGGSE